MPPIAPVNMSYGRDLDLNLLRVFVVVAEVGSVTEAAKRLYLTQPAVSSSLKRLAETIGAPLFVRQGRGIALTARGSELLATARPHLDALVRAALAPRTFDPRASTQTLRIGLSDFAIRWLLPPLIRRLGREAPRMRVIALPIQFRTVVSHLTSSAIDLAITVADETPDGVLRAPLFRGSFCCLYDPRHAQVPTRGGEAALTVKSYLAHAHVVVSYNGDLRGVVEDLLGLQRDVRVSIPSFDGIGSIVRGSALLATVPSPVADREIKQFKPLAKIALPFSVPSAPTELLWREALDDDPANAFVRAAIAKIATRVFPT